MIRGCLFVGNRDRLRRQAVAGMWFKKTRGDKDRTEGAALQQTTPGAQHQPLYEDIGGPIKKAGSHTTIVNTLYGAMEPGSGSPDPKSIACISRLFL